MSREIRIPHSRLSDPHATTVETERAFQGQDLNLHVHEVEQMDDDYKRGERILKVKNTRYVFLGGK